MSTITKDITFTAGQTIPVGSFTHFKLVECPSPVDIVFTTQDGTQIGNANDVDSTYTLLTPIDNNLDKTDINQRVLAYAQITSASAQTIKVSYSGGGSVVDYDKIAGAVTVSGNVSLSGLYNAQSHNAYKYAATSIAPANKGNISIANLLADDQTIVITSILAYVGTAVTNINMFRTNYQGGTVNINYSMTRDVASKALTNFGNVVGSGLRGAGNYCGFNTFPVTNELVEMLPTNDKLILYTGEALELLGGTGVTIGANITYYEIAN